MGPDRLTGAQLAAIWSEALGRPIRYGGDDLVVMEQRLKGMLPGWHAMDLRLMFSRYQTDGAVATATDLARLTTLLGRAPRSYAEFAKNAAAQWAKGRGLEVAVRVMAAPGMPGERTVAATSGWQDRVSVPSRESR